VELKRPKHHRTITYSAVRGLTLVALGAVLGGGGYWGYTKLKKRSVVENYTLRDDILVHGNQNLKEVALTFDDGPRPEIARELLNVLGREDAKATFFVVGAQVEKHPALVRRMMNEGHEVGNHTHTHPRLNGLDAAGIKAEIARCDKAIFQATGARTNLFRPPGMRYDDIVIDTAQSLNYVTVHWNVGAQDFVGRDTSQVAQKVLKNTRPGSVILLHGHPDTIRAIPEIVRTLRAKGYRFVTVSQMLGRLPRPVFVKSNAYAAKEPVAPAVTTAAKPVKRTTRVASNRTRRAKRAPEVPHTGGTYVKPPKAIDVPSWN
jgi:peptidoglycan/xylan/chitin deacetylase (PgdA/CDA1 family)